MRKGPSSNFCHFYVLVAKNVLVIHAFLLTLKLCYYRVIQCNNKTARKPLKEMYEYNNALKLMPLKQRFNDNGII